MIKISIVTGTYNSAKTVRDTFESILKQSYSNYEYIVVDGASKDETVDVIKEYEPKFQGRMRWISEPDKGIYDAMNKGIGRATGDVVGILNSDDFFANENVLATIAAEFAKQPELDAVYADVKYVDWNDTNKLIRYYSSRVFRRWLMRLGFMPAHPTFYCRKSTYVAFAKTTDNGQQTTDGHPNLQFFDTQYKIAADFENLLRMIFVGKIKTQYIKQQFVTMRAGGASSSGAASHKQINRDHQRAFRENGVYSNLLLESLRYLYKVGEILLAKVKG